MYELSHQYQNVRLAVTNRMVGEIIKLISLAVLLVETRMENLKILGESEVNNS